MNELKFEQSLFLGDKIPSGASAVKLRVSDLLNAQKSNLKALGFQWKIWQLLTLEAFN